MLDGGINYNHPDLGDGEFPNSKIVGGYNFYDDNAFPLDYNGHGTAVAGIISAETDNTTGVAGINWDGKLLAYKVCSNSGFCPGDKVVSGIYEANNQGARVMNMSFSGPINDPTMALAVKTVYLSGNSPVLCTSMGNANDYCKRYPSGYLRTAFAVGTYVRNGDRWQAGCMDCNRNDCGSSIGEWIDVSAPGGTGIVTTGISPQYNLSFGGTSAAAPMASGVASLLVSLNSQLTNDDVENLIRVTAREAGQAGFDVEYGHGKIDAKAACSLATLPNLMDHYTTSNTYSYGSLSDLQVWDFQNCGLVPNPVQVQEVRADITLPSADTYFVTPHVWGRAVGSNGSSIDDPYDCNEQVPWSEAINVTTTGCVLRT